MLRFNNNPLTPFKGGIRAAPFKGGLPASPSSFPPRGGTCPGPLKKGKKGGRLLFLFKLTNDGVFGIMKKRRV